MRKDCRLPNAKCRLCRNHSAFGFRHSAFGNRQSAFSFIEVLFAVILLGIGFIMIAGIFPVAIQQTAVVSNETEGTLITRDAIRKLQAVASAPGASAIFTPCPLLNASGQPLPIIQPIGGNLMNALGNDVFYSADRRFAWMGFYRRDSVSSPFAQVFVIALENPNFPNYQANPTTLPSGTLVPPVCPPLPQSGYGNANGNNYGNGPAWITSGPLAGAPAPTTTVTFTYDSPAGSGNTRVDFPTAVPPLLNPVTGAYMLVWSDNPPALPTTYAGRIFRLGAQIATTAGFSQSYYLQPGNDLTSSDGLASGATLTLSIYMVGRAPTPPTAPPPAYAGDFTGPFTGPNQDIAATSAFIRVNTSNN
jgi:hypothetical protein